MFVSNHEQPDQVTSLELEDQLRLGKMFAFGHDKTGRPILYMKKRETGPAPLPIARMYSRYCIVLAPCFCGPDLISFSPSLILCIAVKMIQYSMEKCIRMARCTGQWQLVLLMDMAVHSSSNSPPLSLVMEIIKTMQNYYPECLGMHTCCDMLLARVYFGWIPALFYVRIVLSLVLVLFSVSSYTNSRYLN